MFENLLTLSEAARLLGVTTSTLSRWIHAGLLPAFRTPGGRYRIAVEDLRQTLQRTGTGDLHGSVPRVSA